MSRDMRAGFKQILPQPSEELAVAITLNNHNLVGSRDHCQLGDNNLHVHGSSNVLFILTF